MNNVNKTMYIPLYGKSFVSKKNLFLFDKKAEEIWEKEQFPLKGKSKSKYLAYFMGIRSRVFDDYVKDNIKENTVIIHLGCGLDSRVLRVNTTNKWYDVDFNSVIDERKKYYNESSNYKMISSDIRSETWLNEITEKENAIIIIEGVSMYLTNEELKEVLVNISNHFSSCKILMDSYSILAARLSKYKNPVKDVGVSIVYGLDDPRLIENDKIKFIKEHDITPIKYIEELKGFEKGLFKKLYAGKFSKKLYKIYEFKTMSN